MVLRRPLVTLGSLLGLLGLAALGRGDEVILTPDATVKAAGGRVIGQVQSESPTAVRVQPATGPTQDIPVDQIESITYNGQPPSLGLAESREKTGDLAGALEQYKKAVTEAGTARPTVAEAARFGVARISADQALADASKADEAIGLLEAFVKSHPRSRHLGAAYDLLGRLALAKGDLAKANTAATGLAAIPWAVERGAVLKARILVKEGKADSALQTLDQMLTRAPKTSSRSVELRLARAETLAAAGNFSEAESTVQQVIKETPPEKADIQALAHNTLGDCYRVGGKVKDALLAYLKTDILYDQDREQHARALYEIAQLWRKLNQPDRADDAMARLRRAFPQSPYLNK